MKDCPYGIAHLPNPGVSSVLSNVIRHFIIIVHAKPFPAMFFRTKHNGKYYFQYGAPGTEFKVYADGVYVSDSPLGPFTYQQHNPMSYKPGGFLIS